MIVPFEAVVDNYLPGSEGTVPMRGVRIQSCGYEVGALLFRGHTSKNQVAINDCAEDVDIAAFCLVLPDGEVDYHIISQRCDRDCQADGQDMRVSVLGRDELKMTDGLGLTFPRLGLKLAGTDEHEQSRIGLINLDQDWPEQPLRAVNKLAAFDRVVRRRHPQTELYMPGWMRKLREVS